LIHLPAFFTAQDIAKSFHLNPVLSGVSFSLEVGETILLFGRNGCGKTTLLRILAGIMRPEGGRAELNGHSLFTTDSRWREGMVYLGHRPALYPAFTARENLSLSVQLRRQTWDEGKFQSLLERYGLAGREEEPVRVYSEGMLQRLGLVRLGMVSWQLALLDEPSSALDVDGAQLLSETIRYWRSVNRTVFLTSHDMEWGADQADRALLLAQGRIYTELGSPTEHKLISHLSLDKS
jgi:heme ABC exporter ATP-binding subunit CcmA